MLKTFKGKRFVQRIKKIKCYLSKCRWKEIIRCVLRKRCRYDEHPKPRPANNCIEIWKLHSLFSIFGAAAGVCTLALRICVGRNLQCSRVHMRYGSLQCKILRYVRNIKKNGRDGVIYKVWVIGYIARDRCRYIFLVLHYVWHEVWRKILPGFVIKE